MAMEKSGHVKLVKLGEAGVARSARADAAYTKWLKAEIQEAIDDPRPTVPHDEAMRQLRAAIKPGRGRLRARHTHT